MRRRIGADCSRDGEVHTARAWSRGAVLGAKSVRGLDCSCIQVGEPKGVLALQSKEYDVLHGYLLALILYPLRAKLSCSVKPGCSATLSF
jgi:hypothetical protein